MRLRLPSPFAIYAVTVATMFGILTAARGLVDSDFYWHVVAGRLVATHGVLTTDPFSFTWGGHPWVMHEWLGELLLYWMVAGLGVGIATFLFGIISVAGPLLLAATLRRRGASMLGVAIVTTLAMAIYTSYATIRPQAISWLLLGVLLAGLLTIRPEHRWRPWLAVPLFLVWANVHGLYVIGLGVLGTYVLFSLIGRTPMAPRRGEMVVVFLTAFAGSMVTPAGPEGLLYPLRYVEAGDWGLLHISEWQSPDFHEPGRLPLLALIVAMLANGMRATPGWLTALALAGIAGALLATRNVPLAALLAMPTLILGVGARLPRPRSILAPSVQWGRRLIEIGLAAVLVLAAALIIPSLPAVAGSTVVPRNFPIAAVDHLEATIPNAQVFAEYQWGGYVIYRMFETGGQVFVDGRNDMYDERILDDFVAIRNAEDGWSNLLSAYGQVDAILLPPEAPLVRPDTETPGWCEAYRDDVAVLLLHDC